MLEIINKILPSITAICAIIAPVLVTIINNHHQYKLKEMDLKQKTYEQTIIHKRQLFENFLSAFNQVCHLKTEEAISKYSSSYSLVYIYLPKEVRDDLGRINLLIEKHCWEEAIKNVDAISMDILKEIDTLPIR